MKGKRKGKVVRIFPRRRCTPHSGCEEIGVQGIRRERGNRACSIRHEVHELVWRKRGNRARSIRHEVHELVWRKRGNRACSVRHEVQDLVWRKRRNRACSIRHEVEALHLGRRTYEHLMVLWVTRRIER
jgi:hypothetical protein